MMRFILNIISLFVFALPGIADTWHADNGNGTFTNPIFYDEFSDPDLIRVGNLFYLTGTTMHSMPGLPVLCSCDLVNWKLLGYACEKLDLGPEFRLKNGMNIYGQGIWAPSFRYNNGKYYIFSDVNHHNVQLFTATNPAGPWQHDELKRSFHDLSVLFDDDGKVYVVWGYQDLHFAQLTDDLKDIIPGSELILFKKNAGMGEGSHFYKINGKYYITSAWFNGRMRMSCARADKPEGPYEINQAISKDEDFGLAKGFRLRNERNAPPFEVNQPDATDGGRMSLHQGGLVQTSAGEWWGFSMMDYNSVGRLTCLSPITWTNAWPYFGLPGNLCRTPRTWVKPSTGCNSEPFAPYKRDDDFSRPGLANAWQWNHIPNDAKWSLSERKGFLRLHSMPATNLWTARNTLTQRAIGPRSVPTAELETDGMKPGDIAGLALFNFPYAWIGACCQSNGLKLTLYNQLTGEMNSVQLPSRRIWLRAYCDFITEKATFSYSTDGKSFKPEGGEFIMVYQGRTFQGVRYGLFHYNVSGVEGGYADFKQFAVDEPTPHGLTRQIPYGQTIVLTNVADGSALSVDGEFKFKVVNRGMGRVAFQTSRGFISVNPADATLSIKNEGPATTETFQWIETPYGDVVFLALTTDRYICAIPEGIFLANHTGPKPGRRDGSCFNWLDSNT